MSNDKLGSWWTPPPVPSELQINSDSRQQGSTYERQSLTMSPRYEQLAKNEWPKPMPLRTEKAPSEYPIEHLPPVIREAIEEVQQDSQAPLAMVATSALSIVSAACQSYVSVERDQNLRGPVSLYCLTIAESGERKSTCDNRFLAGIKKWEADTKVANAPLLRDHDAALKIWKTQDQGLQNAIRKEAEKGDTPKDLQERAMKHAANHPTPPRQPQMLRGDDTPEALRAALKRWPVAAFISSEAGVIFGAHAMNPDVVMRNLAQANICWDGGRIQDGRATRESVDIDGMRVTMGLMVQPKVLEVFVSKNGDMARGIGYFARFLLCNPASTMGTRFYNEPVANSPALNAFQQRIAQIMSRKVPVDEDTGQLNTAWLGLDPEAKAAWASFHDDVELLLGKGAMYYDVRDVASKIAENAARIAANLHYFSGSDASMIGGHTMSHAISIAGWYLYEMSRVYGQAVVPQVVTDAEDLEKWMAKFVTKKRIRCVTVREIQQLGPARLRVDKRAREDAIELLVSHNHAIRERAMQLGKRDEVTLSPHILDDYR